MVLCITPIAVQMEVFLFMRWEGETKIDRLEPEQRLLGCPVQSLSLRGSSVWKRGGEPQVRKLHTLFKEIKMFAFRVDYFTQRNKDVRFFSRLFYVKK